MEFALVVPLLIGLVASVCQLGMWGLAVVRAHDVAGEAARSGARSPRAVVAAREVLRRQLSGPQIGDAHVGPVAGRTAVIAEISVPLELVGWRSPVQAHVSEAALLEPR